MQHIFSKFNAALLIALFAMVSLNVKATAYPLIVTVTNPETGDVQTNDYEVEEGVSFADYLQGYEVDGYGLLWLFIADDPIFGPIELEEYVMPAYQLTAVAVYDKFTVEKVKVCQSDEDNYPYCWNNLLFTESGIYPYFDNELMHLSILDLTVNPVFSYKAVTNYFLPENEPQMGTLVTLQEPACDNNNEWIVEAQETNADYYFTQWDDSTTEKTRTILLTKDTVIVANFARVEPEPQPQSLSELYNITFGTLDSNKGNVKAWLELEAVANKDYSFVNWAGSDPQDPAWSWYDANVATKIDLDRSLVLQAVFVNNDVNMKSGMDDVLLDNTVFAEDNAISVIGHQGYDLRIYSVVGQLVYQGAITEEITKVNVPAHNIYLVKVGTQIAKVIVK